MSEQMRECPFCGGDTFVPHTIGGPITRYWAECRQCHAIGSVKYTEAKAIAAWNQRAAPKPAPEALHGYWQVEPIEAQPPTITTTYCQGCQEKEAEIQRLQDREHWLMGQNKRLQEILDGWEVGDAD